MRIVVAGCLMAVVAVSSAAAERAPLPDPSTSSWFYNRPGASAADREQDEAQCLAFANGLSPISEETPYASQFGLVGAMIAAAGQNRLAARLPRLRLEFLDDCMIAKGYRRFQVDGIAMEALAQRVLQSDVAVLDRWAGGEPPEGALTRAFENEVWLTTSGEVRPALASYPLLRQRVSNFSLGGPPNRGLRERDPITPSPNQAVLIGSVHSRDRGTFLMSLIAVSEDGRPMVELGRSASLLLEGSGGGRTTTRIFVVPAGRYVIQGVNFFSGASYGGQSFCLRTAAFAIGPGETRHLGELTFERPQQRQEESFAGHRFGTTFQPRVRIDAPNLEQGRLALGRDPVRAGALQPVEWRNGASFPCVPIASLYPEIGLFDVETGLAAE